jgi:hypothetical protein
MTPDEVAQKMLEVLPDEEHWAIGNAFTRRYTLDESGRVVSHHPAHCLLGARAAVDGMDLDTSAAIVRYRKDAYLHRLIHVIREQYPEMRHCEEELDLIWEFNDSHSFADVRLVLEKAAVIESENGV